MSERSGCVVDGKKISGCESLGRIMFKAASAGRASNFSAMETDRTFAKARLAQCSCAVATKPNRLNLLVCSCEPPSHLTGIRAPRCFNPSLGPRVKRPVEPPSQPLSSPFRYPHF